MPISIGPMVALPASSRSSLADRLADCSPGITSTLAGATLGLLIGGIAAAPIGAFAAKHFPAKQMLILVGVVLTLTSGYGVWKAWG